MLFEITNLKFETAVFGTSPVIQGLEDLLDRKIARPAEFVGRIRVRKSDVRV